MTHDSMNAAVAAWAARGLPARLDVGTTAKLLGFAEHDIQILTRSGKLTPLGDPAPNAPKWFPTTSELIRRAIRAYYVLVQLNEDKAQIRHNDGTVERLAGLL